MESDLKKDEIRRFVAQAARPAKDTRRCINHYTIIGGHNIIAEHVIVHDRLSLQDQVQT